MDLIPWTETYVQSKRSWILPCCWHHYWTCSPDFSRLVIIITWRFHIHVCVSVSVSTCNVCAGVSGSMKKASLELELRGSYKQFDVGAAKQSWVLWKSRKCSQTLSHLSIPKISSIFHRLVQGDCSPKCGYSKRDRCQMPLKLELQTKHGSSPRAAKALNFYVIILAHLWQQSLLK